MIRRRKPGGGRKPKGSIRAKSEVFTTRITPDTRAAIEREAKRSGQSISQVAERLLMLGLEARRRRENRRPLRAFCFLIEQLAGRVSDQWMDASRPEFDRRTVENLQDEWRTDPFRYKAFTIAVQSLLNALKPKGEIEPPFAPELIEEAIAAHDPAFSEFMKNTYATPENLAAWVFANFWTQLNRENPLADREVEVMRGGDWVGEAMREEYYALQDARRDLHLGSNHEEKAK